MNYHALRSDRWRGTVVSSVLLRRGEIGHLHCRCAAASSVAINEKRLFSAAHYGSPYTDSIQCVPTPSQSKVGSAASFTIMFGIPTLPRSEISVLVTDTVSECCRSIADAAAAGSMEVQLVRNGVPVASSTQLLPSSQEPFASLLGSSVDISFDKIRYSVNDGARLSLTHKDGRVPKRSLLRNYVYVGGAATVAATVVVAGVLYFR